MKLLVTFKSRTNTGRPSLGASDLEIKKVIECFLDPKSCGISLPEATDYQEAFGSIGKKWISRNFKDFFH